jgi:hypothetical protein
LHHNISLFWQDKKNIGAALPFTGFKEAYQRLRRRKPSTRGYEVFPPFPPQRACEDFPLA